MAGLAYTQHSFTIESYYNNHHNSYLLTTKNGELGIVELSSVPTSEPTGLKLSFPVKYEHITNFKEEARKLYRFFDYKPTLNIDLDITTPKTTHLLTDYFMLEESTYNNYVLMSNVVYKIESSNLINEKGFTGVVLKVPNGEVTYSPNRESLILDEETVAYLNNKFNYIYDDFLTTVNTTLNNAPTISEYITLFTAYMSSMPYRLRCNFTVNWSGILSTMLTSSSIGIITSILSNVETYAWNNYSKGFKLEHLKTLTTFNEGNIIIIDQKTRFRDAAKSLHNGNAVVFKVTDPTDLATLKQQLTDQGFSYDLTSEHTAPDIRSTSKKAKRVKTEMPYVCNYGYNKFLSNHLATSDVTYLYVPLTRYDSDIENFQSYLYTLRAYNDNNKTFTYKNKTYDVANCRLVGVQKAYQASAKALDNFLPLVDVLNVIHKKLVLYTYPSKELSKLQECSLLPSKLTQRVKDLKKFAVLPNSVYPSVAESIAIAYPNIPYTKYEYVDSTKDLYATYPMLEYILNYRSYNLNHYTELEYIYEQSQNCKISK